MHGTVVGSNVEATLFPLRHAETAIPRERAVVAARCGGDVVSFTVPTPGSTCTGTPSRTPCSQLRGCFLLAGRRRLRSQLLPATLRSQCSSRSTCCPKLVAPDWAHVLSFRLLLVPVMRTVCAEHVVPPPVADQQLQYPCRCQPCLAAHSGAVSLKPCCVAP